MKADGTPENVAMYPYEIATRLSSLSLLDYTAQPVPDGIYSDLDAVERERLRNIIRAYMGDAALLELSDEELDKSFTICNGTEQSACTYFLRYPYDRKDRGGKKISSDGRSRRYR